MSLLQYKMYSGGSPAASSSVRSSAAASGTGARIGYSGRSITPMRYVSGSSILAYDGGGNTTPPMSPTAAGAMQRGGSSGGYGGGSSASALARSQPAPMAGLRAPSADRASERASSLRATLHTDTLRAADRPRTILDRNFNQSADIGSIRVSGFVVGGSSSGGGGGGGSLFRRSASGTPSATSAGQLAMGAKHGAPIARTLAPNGQPRKVPVSILPQYHAGMAAANRPGGIVPTSAPSSGRQGLLSK